MSAVAAERTADAEATGKPAASIEHARAALLRAASWWSAQARRERFPVDRLWVGFSCGACERTLDEVFRLPMSPWTGEAGGPLYRDASEIEQLVADAVARRPRVIEPSEWELAAKCPCGAPHHHRRAVGAALLHTLVGQGAGLIAARFEGEPTSWLRLADGAGAPETLSAGPGSLRAGLGRALTLFDAWKDLVDEVPVPAGKVVGRDVEVGVWLFAASNESDLAAGVAAKLGGTRRVLVRLDPDTVRSMAWPASLEPLARALDAGGALALVLEAEVLLAQACAWARCTLDADVVVEGRWLLRTGAGDWPLMPERVALSMVRVGRTLPEAVAAEIARAEAALDDRIQTLRILTELVPGSSFEVQGTRATARLVDGRGGQTLDVTDIPEGASTLSADDLAREAAFLFDVAPPWADRTRVCPCGAAVTVDRKLIAWPPPSTDGRPWVLQTWGTEERASAAEVVALCCDRHVRILPEAVLRGFGLDDARLAAELSSTGPTRQVVHATVWAEEATLVASGAWVSSAVLSDGRVRALLDAAKQPPSERVHAWAIGTDLLVVLGATEDASSEDLDARTRRALLELGHTSPEPFWIRREVSLEVPPHGGFDVTLERR